MLSRPLTRSVHSARRLAALALALVALAAAGTPALASHAGTTVDCGSAGTFTVRAMQTAAGDHQAPEPSSIIVFREGGALTVFEFRVNGVLRFTLADRGRQQNALDEVTCSFENEAGARFQVTGILAGA
jgi:hypothetical protein